LHTLPPPPPGEKLAFSLAPKAEGIRTPVLYIRKLPVADAAEQAALAAADQSLLDTLREVGTTWEPRGTQ